VTSLAQKKEELDRELDSAKKSLKEKSRTRRRLDKVLHDAAFAVQSLQTVNTKISSFVITTVCLTKIRQISIIRSTQYKHTFESVVPM